MEASASPVASPCSSSDDRTARHTAGEAAAHGPPPPPPPPPLPLPLDSAPRHPVPQRPIDPVPHSQDCPSPHVPLAPPPQRPSVEVRLEAGVPCGKLYPDLRHAFVGKLWAHAIGLRTASHQKSALDATVRAILAVALHPYPLRSAEAALSLAGIGDELCDCLRHVPGAELEGDDSSGIDDGEEARSQSGRSGARGGQRRGGQRAGGAGGSRRGPVSNPPPAGKYASAAEACLVALLEFTEMQSSAGVGDGGAGGSSAG